MGTAYFGWQRTHAGKSIQGELEAVLERLFQERPVCEAASRTDRGVHAEGQVVQFYVSREFSGDLRRAMNALLPEDIRVQTANLVSLDFHPTLDAKKKTYYYRWTKVLDPFIRQTAWHYPYDVDLGLMRTEPLLGKADFSRFSTEVPKNPICDLLEVTIEPGLISMTGDRFLYKMARRIAGTLLNIGSGKITPGQVGETAPAHGLTLHKIEYSYDRSK